jgi:pre-mRNA-splicing factor CDC5/CEF1
LQKSLPRPTVVDIETLLKVETSSDSNAIQNMIAEEMANLIGTDSLRYPITGGRVSGVPKPLQRFEDELLEKARMEILLELPQDVAEKAGSEFEEAWLKVHSASTGSSLPGLAEYKDEADGEQLMVKTFDVCLPFTFISTPVLVGIS